MPAVAAITVKDGEATPLDHVFVPVKVDQDTATFVERVGQTTIGNRSLAVSVKAGQKSSPVIRVGLSLDSPALITSTPPGSSATVETVDSSNKVNVEFLFAKKGTRQGRVNLRSMLLNALKDPKVLLAIDDVENFY